MSKPIKTDYNKDLTQRTTRNRVVMMIGEFRAVYERIPADNDANFDEALEGLQALFGDGGIQNEYALPNGKRHFLYSNFTYHKNIKLKFS